MGVGCFWLNETVHSELQSSPDAVFVIKLLDYGGGGGQGVGKLQLIRRK